MPFRRTPALLAVIATLLTSTGQAGDSGLVEEKQTRMDNASPALFPSETSRNHWHPGLRSMTKLRLLVSQDCQPATCSLPIESLLTWWISPTGMEIGTGVDPKDTTSGLLEFQLTGKPLSQKTKDGRRAYTGASLAGSIRLYRSSDDRSPLMTLPFSAIDPANAVIAWVKPGDNPYSPQYAPFERALLGGSFPASLAGFFEKCFGQEYLGIVLQQNIDEALRREGPSSGPEDAATYLSRVLRSSVLEHVSGTRRNSHRTEILLLGLRDPSWWSRDKAAAGLASVREARVVSALIRTLAKDTWETHAALSGALRRITGKDFGDNADRWESWWRRAEPTWK